MQPRAFIQIFHNVRPAGGIVAILSIMAALQLSSCGSATGPVNAVQSSPRSQLPDAEQLLPPEANSSSSSQSSSESSAAPATRVPSKATPMAAMYWPLWQCNAYPVNGMPFMYWIHANAAFAARTAMAACLNTYYVPCNYSCFRIR